MESLKSERTPAASPENREGIQEKRIEELEALLQKERAEHKAQVEYLETQVGIDYLTGISNRRTFEHELDKSLKFIRGEIEEQSNVEMPRELSLILIDLDHFKQINDTHGHPVGDEVLKKVAALLVDSVREDDTVARVGGEELMVLLQGASHVSAAQKAEELRAKIEQLTFDAHPELIVTASLGVVSSEVSTDPKTLYECADKALYRAKETGRNRVEVCTEKKT